MDNAHRYFAFTGAGHLPAGGLLTRADTPLPVCGAATGIEPMDMVVMEFSIGSDGAKIAPTTIYSSRPGLIEAPFERAVARWSWDPDGLAKLPPFWRHSVRLQLRCSGSGKRGDLTTTFRAEASGWMAAMGYLSAPEASSDAARLPLLRAELMRRQDPQTIPMLMAIADNSVIDPSQRLAVLDRLIGLLQKQQAPANLQILFEMRRESALFDLPNRQRVAATSGPWVERWDELLQSIAARGYSQTRAAALVHIVFAQFLERQAASPTAVKHYQIVVDLPKSVLPDGDPIRQVALLRIASSAAANSEFETARAALAATGLSPDQCALADVRPAMAARPKISSGDFPDVALTWGFEGFASVDYDIDPSGNPANVRAVISYPPFIFAKATEKIVGKFRYQPIFRDGAAAGCDGMVQNVRFNIPQRH